MTRTTKSDFSPEEINFDNMNDLKIEIFVKDRTTWGRRFTISYDSKTSDQVIFNDIFKTFQKMTKNEGNIENLKKAKEFLGKLRDAETRANSEYDAKGTGYKILTWISRIFSSGSHSDDIQNLETKIQDKLDELNLDENMRKINEPDLADKRNVLLRNLAWKYLYTNNLDNTYTITEYVEGVQKKDALYLKLAEAYIAQNNPDDALRVVADRISAGTDQKEKDALYEKIGNLCWGNDDKALLMSVAALSIQGASSVKDDLLLHAAKVFVKKGDPEKAEQIMANRKSSLDGNAKIFFWGDVMKAYQAKGDIGNAIRIGNYII